jgi:nitrite reductase/ring-hydroxylating ferredoxin subunit
MGESRRQARPARRARPGAGAPHDAGGLKGRFPLRVFHAPPWPRQEPTYPDADPAVITAAYRRAQRRPWGNWYVVGSSREIPAGRPVGRTVDDVEVVLWRDTEGRLRAGPGACPHLGAPLADAVLHEGRLVCRWHGLTLDDKAGRGGENGGGTGQGGGNGGGNGQERLGGWCPLPAHDDGVLAWVRLDRLGGQPPTDRPLVPRRPDGAVLDGVATVVGRCQPRDVVRNRLDPWHGAWLHPYSFANLRVLGAPPTDPELPPERDVFTLEVTFRVAGRVGVPVLAEFSCPGPRTVVMRIVAGEGTDSVVETHATPIGTGSDGAPRTAVVEAVVATSPRPGFAVARAAAPLVRPAMAWAARRLWRDDIAYAERTYALRADAGGRR